MRGKARVAAIVCGVVLALMPLEPASAHVGTIETTLSIAKSPAGVTDPGDQVVIHGRLNPRRCRDGQEVNLYRVRPGPDALIGTDVLDADGEYSLTKRPRRDMRVYAKVKQHIISNYQHTHTCTKDRSPKLLINVS